MPLAYSSTRCYGDRQRCPIRYPSCNRAGHVVVQDWSEASFSSLPRSALAAVPHARAAPAEALGPLLTAILKELPEHADQAMGDESRSQAELRMEDSANPGFLQPDEAEGGPDGLPGVQRCPAAHRPVLAMIKATLIPPETATVGH
jgi:hypothetical protein